MLSRQLSGTLEHTTPIEVDFLLYISAQKIKLDMIQHKIARKWTQFWMRFAGLSYLGRISTRLATMFAPPYYGRCGFSCLNPKGYFAPSATVHHNSVHFGKNVFIGDRVVIFQDKDGGVVEIGDRVHVYGEAFIQTGSGGSIKIGDDSHIHPRCQISAYKSSILIGDQVQIAPNCAFYPYNHATEPGKLIREQPFCSKGDIIVGDDVWMGFGVIVLDGVRIGKGAVIGAGSVVTHDIPDGGIAVGSPARVVKMRDEYPEKMQEINNQGQSN